MLKKSKIKSIKAKEIFDSNGKATVEAKLETDFGVFRASVPSGLSRGKYEAVELRDKDGGVKKAIENIEKVIAPALKTEDLTNQKRVDEILIQLDGTNNKSRLGANATLPISIAVCRAGAAAGNLPPYQYIRQLVGENGSPITFPGPSFNMIEGGKHAKNQLAFQEFMIIPQKEIFQENLNVGIKIYRKLREVLEKKFFGKNVALSKEGAFAPALKEISEAFDLILEAAENAGYKSNIKLAIDAAASSFFSKTGYKIDDKILTKEKLIDFYQAIIQKYPIASFEDPFEEEDYDAWSAFKYKIQNTQYKIQIFGDDLTTSNLERIRMAYDKNLCDGVIIKPNQIGTVTETIEAAKLAKKFHWKIMVSNRAGETEDDFIADLAVGIGADFIKSGAPFPKERMAKYNRLVEIEKEICPVK